MRRHVDDPFAQSWPGASMQSSTEIIVGADVDGRIALWSTGAERFYGYTAEEMASSSISKLRPHFDMGDLPQLMARLLSGQEVPPYETRHRLKNGQLVDVSISPWPVRDAGGEVIGLCAVIRDAGDAKRSAVELEEANEHHVRLLERLQELERVRSTFVSSVSHELRTPLTSILGYTELLEDDPSLSEDQREMLDIVSRNSQRLLSLIEDILVMSTIESDAFTVLKEPVDVRMLVTETCRALAHDVTGAGHVMHIEIGPDVGSVLGDADELERVIENLLTNAIKFTPNGGDIRVVAERRPNGVEIKVSDNGIGLDAQEQAEMFTPFFRAAEAMRRAIPGTGLGLSIVRSIVEKHGGTIKCESVEGEGTTMLVVLPYAMASSRIAS